MDEFGIRYSFVHADGSHKLVVSNQNSEFDPAVGATRKFITLSGQDRRTQWSIHELEAGRQGIV